LESRADSSGDTSLRDTGGDERPAAGDERPAAGDERPAAREDELDAVPPTDTEVGAMLEASGTDAQGVGTDADGADGAVDVDGVQDGEAGSADADVSSEAATDGSDVSSEAATDGSEGGVPPCNSAPFSDVCVGCCADRNPDGVRSFQAYLYGCACSNCYSL